MNILLTGSLGFIGSYFLQKYNKKYNIKTFSFRNDDFDKLDLSDIDIVVHLSALVHQMQGAKKDKYYRVNVEQTIQLAKKAKESGVKQFIFMSTIKVYGEEADIAYNENSNCNPVDYYGKSKLEAENKLLELESNDFIVSIIRTPIVYGYGVKGNIQNLIKLIKKVNVLPFKNINNKRSMVYIGNLCYLIDELILQRQKGVFLASDDETISTSSFIKLIAKNLNKKIYLIKIPLFEYMLKHLKPNIYQRIYGSLIVNNQITKERLNLNNPYSIEEGIKYMLIGEKL